ncbi:substrate-binding domain-containing protein, partial [Paraburkholderia sp. CNPSo 3076]|uniref:substrate-binding domain-containing protein n=1 Tax=Paraburkholderia sp. CNPSo 3076 TaxID=2940936 RepID=UPI002251B0C5
LAREGIEDVPEELVAPPSSVAHGKRALPPLLARAPDIDAVFCGSDLLAIGALGAARQMGVQVPSQLAICGFGDLEFATETTPQLTTVRVEGTRIGVNAARFLLDRLSGETGVSEPRALDVGFTIVARESA